MQYLIANWKAEMTYADIQPWVTRFLELLNSHEELQEALQSKKISIIICPPSPFILPLIEQLKQTGLQVGAQDISSREHGKFTGEITAEALKGIVPYAIIGHSERRTHFAESEEAIAAKLRQCHAHNITPILCVRGTNDVIESAANIVAYEPVDAIGSGQNADPTDVIAVKKQLTLPQEAAFLYGGSVNADNIKDYKHTNEIQGYLVGSASLDADIFFSLAAKLV